MVILGYCKTEFEIIIDYCTSGNESELVSRIYETQKISNSVGDWVRHVEADKLELGINLTNCEFQGVSQNVFKSLKREKKSKDKFLNCSVLKQAYYLAHSRFST